jgi:serine/threonine-protein kinase
VAPSAHNPDVPDVFDSIVAKAMAKNRANRYSSAEDLRTDLLRFNQGHAVAAGPLLPADAVTGVMARPGGGDTTRVQPGVDGTRMATANEMVLVRARGRCWSTSSGPGPGPAPTS